MPVFKALSETCLNEPISNMKAQSPKLRRRFSGASSSPVSVSAEEAQQVSELMKEGMRLQDRTRFLVTYKNTFTGAEAVGWMSRYLSTLDLEACIDFGNSLIRAGVFSHVTRGHLLENSPNLWYNFCEKSYVTRDTSDDITDADMLSIFRQMQAELEVKTRRYHFATYRECFLGTDAVKWIKKYLACDNTRRCIHLGDRMISAGLFQHVHNEHLLKDDDLFYRFSPDALPRALQRISSQPLV